MIIDVLTGLPTPTRIAYDLATWGALPAYRSVYGSKWGAQLGLPAAIVAQLHDLRKDNFLTAAAKILDEYLAPVPHHVLQLREAGIDRAVIHGSLVIGDVAAINNDTAALAEKAPDLFIPFCRVDPTRGQEAATEIHRCARLGMRGISMTPFWHGISCDDDVTLPVFETARELGLPIWIHQSTNLKADTPLALEAPLHLDRIAGRFPEVQIIVGHGGWPWSAETVAIAWRHNNVWIETSAFRPKNIFTPGSGWEPVVYYGQRVLKERMLFGSTWSMVGLSPKEAVDEARSVPWPDHVKVKWLGENAAALLRLDGQAA